nr:hypothetical protein [Listeria rocourtiae]
MIEVEHKWIKEIPVLHVYDATHATEKLPTVFFLSRFSIAKGVIFAVRLFISATRHAGDIARRGNAWRKICR